MAVQPETLDTFDDRRVVAAFQAGDEDAFARIVGAHYSSLMAEARRRLHSSGDAEDAVQETLLRAYLALDRFGGEYHLRAWLGRILANACADVHSRRAGEGRLHDRLASRREIAPAADDTLGDSDVRRVVREAVASLPESYRVAFVLREVEERPYSELAETMHVTEDNARARVHRARGALQRSLKSVGGTLGGLAVPLRLIALRLRPSHPANAGRRSLNASGKAADTLSSANGTRTAHAVHAGPVLSAPVRRVPLADISAASQAASQAATSASSSVPLTPLAQVSQVLGQAAASPLSQTIMAMAPEAGKATMPVAGTLATLAAAGAAMVGSGVGLVNQAAPAPTTPAAMATAPAGSLISYGQAPASTSPTISHELVGSSSSSNTPPTSSPSSPANSSSPASNPSPAAPGGDNTWSWVNAAASSPASKGSSASATAGSGSSTSSSTGSSSSVNSVPGTTLPSGPITSAVGPVTCPYTNSFPGAAPGPVAPSTPEPAGESATDYFTSQMSLPNTPAFETQGQGTVSDSGGSVPVNALAGICLSNTASPVLVVNLTQEADATASIFQLRGGLVGSSQSGGVVNTLYRGTGVWLSGLDADSPPVPFVADVITPDEGGLLVAFFGPIPGLSTTPVTSVPAVDSTPATSGSSPTISGSSSTTSSSSTTPSSSTNPESQSPGAGSSGADSSGASYTGTKSPGNFTVGTTPPTSGGGSAPSSG